MTTDPGYMLNKPPKPSPLKVKFDQVVIPMSINGVAVVEGGLETLSVRTRKRPMRMLALAFGAGCLLAALVDWPEPRRA